MYPFSKVKSVSFIGIISLATGIIVIVGWILDIPLLLSVVPGYVSMKFNTALCFLLSGSALLVTQFPIKKSNTILFSILSFLTIIIGSLSLLQDLFHFNAGIDQLFVTDKIALAQKSPFPGRMAPNTAVCFVFIGVAFIGFTTKNTFFHTLAQYLLHLVTAISAVALIGYLYGLSLFYSLSYVSSMAVHTAVLLFFLSMIASLLRPSLGITALFTGTQIGNKMARRLFILMVFMVVVFGSFRVQTQHYHLLSLEIGVSLLVICFLAANLAIIWHTANWLNRIDSERGDAEEEVKALNEHLEIKVEERSAALLNLFDKLKKSEEDYRSLIEHASDAIYVLDNENNFKDANASMCKMTGYTKDELLMLKVTDLLDPEQLKTDPILQGPYQHDHAIIRERRYVRKGGEIFEAEINVKMFGSDRVLVIARDVTDRKKMETELRDAELKFRTLVEKSIVGVYIVRDGKFVYVNPRFAQVFGYEPHELENAHPVDVIIHETYRDTSTEHIRARMAGEVESVHYEATGKKKDGSLNRVEFFGSMAVLDGKPNIIGSMIDITERWNAEEIVKRSEANLTTILDTTDTAYALFDKDLKAMTFNQAAAKFTRRHYNFDPQVGDKLADYFPQDRLPQFIEWAGEVLTGSNISYEANYPQPDASVCWYYVRLFPITNDQKEIFGIMLELSDISERKNAENDLQAAYQKIQAHVSSIKEMAWKQSHLLRSPLANLKGLIQLLEADPSDMEVQEFINTELDRMDKVIIEMAEDASGNEGV